jgi:hypothetical protein
MAEEIYGVGITNNPDQFPRLAGVSIEKQSSMPVLSGLAFGYERRKKAIVMTNRGYANVIHDSKKIALTDIGHAVNLNQNNPNNLIYQLI